MNYELIMQSELAAWRKKMQSKPGVFNTLSKKIQTKINTWIPEKVHNAITVTIKQMIRGVLFGAGRTTARPSAVSDLYETEQVILKKIEIYRKTAAIEGGVTGAGGILLGLADFPILIGIKIKLLFDMAALYGFDTDDYKERVYLLYIFELSFSSDSHRTSIYNKMTNWNEKSRQLPADINDFDWRNFQQEYRDYIDLAKMAQLIPVIGAPVGLIVNYSLIKKLGITAMNAYRMRIFERRTISV